MSKVGVASPNEKDLLPKIHVSRSTSHDLKKVQVSNFEGVFADGVG